MAYWQSWLSGPESGGRDSGVRGAGAVYGWRGPVEAAQCIECRCEARDLRHWLGGIGWGPDGGRGRVDAEL